MSSNQTNQVDPGDSATDLTSPLHDQADELAQSSGATGHAASALLHLMASTMETSTTVTVFFQARLQTSRISK